MLNDSDTKSIAEEVRALKGTLGEDGRPTLVTRAIERVAARRGMKMKTVSSAYYRVYAGGDRNGHHHKLIPMLHHMGGANGVMMSSLVEDVRVALDALEAFVLEREAEYASAKEMAAKFAGVSGARVEQLTPEERAMVMDGH